MGFSDDLLEVIPTMRRYARALARNQDFADDLVQTSLERALARRHLFRLTPGGSLKSWVFAILHNTFVNEMKRAHRRYEHSSERMPDPVQPETQTARLAFNEVATAFEELSDDHRAILSLVVLEGCSYEETAGILGIPKGTVMSRLSRARAALDAAVGRPKETVMRRVK